MKTHVLADRRTQKPQSGTVIKNRAVLAAMYTGLTTTIVAAIVPYIDRATTNSLAGHLRAGYPTYTQGRIDTAVTTYLVYLSIIGMLGVAGWVWIIHAISTGNRLARGAASAMFTLATIVALTGLLIKDTSGDTGLPHLLGWVGVLPCLPGLVAVALLWRRPRPVPHR